MSIITLTTDFGNKDFFVSSVKGAILSEVKNAMIIDVSNEIVILVNISEEKKM